MPSMTDPRELFLHELQDVYYAEKQIAKKLPSMAKEATDRELSDGFRRHLDETKQQVTNLEQVFSALGERPKGEECPGIDGIAEEHDMFMREEQPSPEIRDMFLTGAASRVEHYEIAAYTGLITMARGLGERECVQLLQENLAQEKETLKAVEGVAKRMAKQAKQLAPA
jgi:ferritin-like metal-binding protein YciE